MERKSERGRDEKERAIQTPYLIGDECLGRVTDACKRNTPSLAAFLDGPASGHVQTQKCPFNMGEKRLGTGRWARVTRSLPVR